MIFFNKQLDLSVIFNISENKKELEEIAKMGESSSLLSVEEKNNYPNLVGIYSYIYGYNEGLVDFELIGFVNVLSRLITDESINFGTSTQKDMEIENQAIDYLNSIADLDDESKAKSLLTFLLQKYKRKGELVRMSVLLSTDQINKINDLQGESFDDKLSRIVDSYLGYYEQNRM